MARVLICIIMCFCSMAPARAGELYALPSPGSGQSDLFRLGDAPCGYPLLVVPFGSVNALAVWDPQYGDAIVISTEALKESAPFQRFMLAHECAHFRLGHLLKASWGPMGSPRLEFEADCDAIRHELADDPEAVEAFIERLHGLSSDEIHPMPDDRIANIRACQGKSWQAISLY